MTQEEFSVSAFQRFLDQRKLVGVSCGACGRVYVPPRSICSACPDARMELRELSGRGTLAGYTSIYVAPTAMVAQGFGRDNPYLTGIVTLEEGPRLSARLAGMDARQPEGIAIGTALQADFLEQQEGEETRTVLVFHPASGGVWATG